MQTWTFPSKSSPGVTYTVTHADNGVMGCNCRGWTMAKIGKPRECTHVRQVIADEGFARTVKDGYVFASAGSPAQGFIAGGGSVVQGNFGVALAPASVVEPEQVAPAYCMTAPPPMLASGMTTPVECEAFNAKYGDGSWTLDEKLDGWRVLIVKRGADVMFWARSGNVMQVPKHVVLAALQLPDGIFDGEIMVPGGNSWNVKDLSKQEDLVLVLFDVLEVFGHDTKGETQTVRREILTLAVGHVMSDDLVMVAEMEPTWANVEAIWARGGEGAILKRRNGTYRPDYRTDAWVKVVKRLVTVVTITGFKPGSNSKQGVTLIAGLPGIKSVKTGAGRISIQKEVDANPDSFLQRRLVVSYTLRGGKPMHCTWDHLAGDGE